MAIPRSFKRKLLFCIGLGGVVFLILALVPERHELMAAARNFHWRYLPLALALALINYLIRAVRWHWYLRYLNIPLPLNESISIFLIGLMMSVTPGKAGELFKAYLAKLARGIPMSRTAPVVVVERLTDLTGTLILATIGLAAVHARGWMILLLWLMLAGGLFILTRKSWMLKLLSLAGGGAGSEPSSSSATASQSIPGKLQRSYLSLSELLTPACLAGGTLLSAAAWFSECISLLVVLHGFGESIHWIEATFIYTFATLAGAALFFLPGGIGGTEATMVAMLREISHTGAAVASLATVLTRMVTLWFAAAIGFAALFFCPLPVSEEVEADMKKENEAL